MSKKLTSQSIGHTLFNIHIYDQTFLAASTFFVVFVILHLRYISHRLSFESRPDQSQTCYIKPISILMKTGRFERK